MRIAPPRTGGGAVIAAFFAIAFLFPKKSREDAHGVAPAPEALAR